MRLFQKLRALFKAEAPPPERVVVKESDVAHLKLLAFLQKEGKLLDFLQEDITPYSDAQLGAAVRKIHARCQEGLEEVVTLRPIYAEEEGAAVTLEKGFDPATVRVTGRVWGKPPYRGVLRHKGWKAEKELLPKELAIESSAIVCPAEVEVKS